MAPARARASVLVLAAMLAADAGRAAEPVQPVDEEFLEFLGPVDVNDEEWSEVLKAVEEEAKAREVEGEKEQGED